MSDGVSLKFMSTMTWHTHYLEKKNMALHLKKVADLWFLDSLHLDLLSLYSTMVSLADKKQHRCAME